MTGPAGRRVYVSADMEGITGIHAAVVCIGYHARAGALGVLSHSLLGHEIEDIWLNGRLAGEIGLAHATAVALGVPVAALSGDDAACAEMAAWDRSVATVPVKQAVDRVAAGPRGSRGLLGTADL